MPSVLHEALVTLFRECPSLGLTLARGVLKLDIPETAKVAIEAAEFAELLPAEYRADIVLRVDDEDGQPRDVFIIEVQLAKNPKKRVSWPIYSVGARARFGCPATVMVIAVDEDVAKWCEQPIVLDRAGSLFRPLVIGPGEIPVVTELETARRMPELAVLSAVMHGNEEGAESIGLAALAGCGELDNPRSSLYADLILAHLNEAARHALEALMELNEYTYQSDFAKKYYAEGQRKMLRNLLAERFGKLPESVEGKLEQANSEQLDEWGRRVLIVATLADVFAEQT